MAEQVIQGLITRGISGDLLDDELSDFYHVSNIRFEEWSKDGTVGKVFVDVKDGPVFLDDMASDKMRNAAAMAKLAGMQLAANPPEPQAPNNAETTSQQEDNQPTQSEDDEDEKAQADKTDSSAQKSKAVSTTGRAKNDSKSKTTTHARAVEDRPDVLQQHTGIMLAFMIDPETANQLAIPDGENPGDMHVTLAYMGNTNDEPKQGKLHPVQSLDNLKIILSAFAKNAASLQGHVGGLARFMPSSSSNGSAPIIALVNAQGLQEWRRSLVNVLSSAGYHVANDFDYTPHITLAYVPADTPMPVDEVANLPLTFNELCLAIGDDRYYFSIGDNNEPESPTKTKVDTGNQASHRGNTQQAATRATTEGITQLGGAGDHPEAKTDYKRWRSRAIEDVKAGRTLRGFTTTAIPADIHSRISAELERCTTADDVRAVFKAAQEGDTSFFALTSL